MQSKTFTVQIKAAGPAEGLEEGQFTAYASIFGNEDSYGDIVVKGAFLESLAAWAASGDVIPVLWGHDSWDPFSNIGGVVTAAEDEKGLLVTAQLDLDNPKAQQVYKLIKGKRINQMSFAYDVVVSERQVEPDDGDVIVLLQKLNLFEVSVVMYGANTETEILAVKTNARALADGLKVGRAISASNESDLRDAMDLIQGVLSSLDTTDDPGKASGQPSGKDEEPSPAKSETARVNPSVDTWASQIALEQRKTFVYSD